MKEVKDEHMRSGKDVALTDMLEPAILWLSR